MKHLNGNDNCGHLGDDHRLASYLSGLLRKILHHHDVDGLSQIVLHELGHENSFGLKRATYLVDNPDFDHLVGVAGFCNKECCHHKKNMWESPETFVCDMKDAEYNNSVKNFLKYSLRKKDVNLNDSQEVKDLGKDLGLETPKILSWKMRHGNHGLLLFDKGEKDHSRWKSDFLHNIVALLSFCGI